MASNVEARAMKMAYDFFERNGWNPEDVSHAKGTHGGYDLCLRKGSRTLTVEVKGSGSLYVGIPDLYYTQVDKDKKLVADFLFVAYFPPTGTEKQAIIPRSDFLDDAFKQVTHYCIKHTYKNRAFVSKHLIDTNQSWLG